MPSSQRLLPPCFAGIVMPSSATCTCPMFRLADAMTTVKMSRHGNQPFGLVDGLHEAGRYKNSWLRDPLNFFREKKSS
jgi:hypothetical protein